MNQPATLNEPGTIELLAQADLLQVLARLFAPPGEEERTWLLANLADLDELVRAGNLPRAELIARALRESLVLLEDASLADWSAEYSRLFEGATECPVNESAYIRRDKGAILADIAGFYQAFGLGLREGLGEKLDHLRCELEFLALTLVLQARAAADGQAEGQAVTRDAFRGFADDHLGSWLPGFSARLLQTTRSQFYANCAALLAEVWSALVERYGLEDEQGKPLVCIEEDPGTPYECGMADTGTC